MISGSFEYDSEESLTIFRNYMEQNRGVKPSMIIYKTEDDDVSLEPIDDADLADVRGFRILPVSGLIAKFPMFSRMGGFGCHKLFEAKSLSKKL